MMQAASAVVNTIFSLSFLPFFTIPVHRLERHTTQHRTSLHISSPPLTMEVVLPQSKHTHTAINFHGRDSTASDYALEFSESEASDGRNLLDTFPGIRWVFPSAPEISSKRFGVDISQWFDMWTTENPHERSDEQLQGLSNSIATTTQLILDEASTIGLENIILCGISQGAAMAIRILLDMDVRLCGYVGFSTWLPEYGQSFPNSERALRTPIFLAHCQDDDVINIKYGEALRERLENLTMPVTWRSYADGGHWINEPRGVDDVVEFLRTVTSKEPSG